MTPCPTSCHSAGLSLTMHDICNAIYVYATYKHDFNQNKIFIFRLLCHLVICKLVRGLSFSCLSSCAFMLLVFIDFEALSIRFVLKCSAAGLKRKRCSTASTLFRLNYIAMHDARADPIRSETKRSGASCKLGVYTHTLHVWRTGARRSV